MLRTGTLATMTSSESSCSVCGLVIAVHMHAICNDCGLPYHLNSRSDLPGDDCGQVWINDEFLSLEFGCNTCLTPPAEAGNLDDVLDAGEAADASGIGENELLAAAEAGSLRHRKTAKGIYLFQRGDVAEFARRQR
jgi:hypothetical protein